MGNRRLAEELVVAGEVVRADRAVGRIVVEEHPGWKSVVCRLVPGAVVVGIVGLGYRLVVRRVESHGLEMMEVVGSHVGAKTSYCQRFMSQLNLLVLDN